MPATEFRVSEMTAPAAFVPAVAFRTVQMISTHGAVHRRAAVLKPETTATDMESGRHPSAMKSAPAARIRIVSRE